MAVVDRLGRLFVSTTDAPLRLLLRSRFGSLSDSSADTHTHTHTHTEANKHTGVILWILFSPIRGASAAVAVCDSHPNLKSFISPYSTFQSYYRIFVGFSRDFSRIFSGKFSGNFPILLRSFFQDFSGVLRGFLRDFSLSIPNSFSFSTDMFQHIFFVIVPESFPGFF